MATRNSTASLSLIAALAACGGARVTTTPSPGTAPAVTRATLPHVIDSMVNAPEFRTALWGVLIVSNVDTVIRPMVFRRWAQIHPFVTLVGALGGVRYFGILGLLIGPLALSYFFELIQMYREEYLNEGLTAP